MKEKVDKVLAELAEYYSDNDARKEMAEDTTEYAMWDIEDDLNARGYSFLINDSTLAIIRKNVKKAVSEAQEGSAYSLMYNLYETGKLNISDSEMNNLIENIE